MERRNFIKSAAAAGIAAASQSSRAQTETNRSHLAGSTHQAPGES